MDEWVPKLAPQLRALVELVAQDGHMTQAAAALGVPQSSMSRRVHALEAELGVPLLVRTGRTVALTPAARQLVAQVRGPLHELELAVGTATGTADPEHGTVRFGFPLTMGSGPVPDFLAAFHFLHPGIRLHLTQAHGSALLEDLRSGDLDLAITIPPPADLRCVRIGTQPIVAALPDDHPLAARAAVRLEELRHETFIANPPSFDLRERTESWCRAAGFGPSVPIEITEFATIRELVGRGLGIALVPQDTGHAQGVVDVPLTDGTSDARSPYRRDAALVWSPLPASPATEQLSRFLQERSAPRPAPRPRRSRR